MNILVITPAFHCPPHDGYRLRVHHLTRELSRHHRLSLITFVDSQEQLKFLPELRAYFEELFLVERNIPRGFWPRFVNLFQAHPYSVAQHNLRTMSEEISKRSSKGDIDAVLVFNAEMAQYAHCLGGLPKVIDAIDAVSEVSRQKIWRTSSPIEKLKAFIDWLKMRDYEARAFRHFDLTLFTTPVDREAVLRNCALLKAEVLPSGVDTEHFRPLGTREDFPSLIFTGAMNYYPNYDAVRYFCRNVFPLIRKERPDVRFYVVGKDPGEKVRLRIRNLENVVVTGFVDDIRPFLDAATVFVCPMRMGMGIKNKLLEAMAMAKPIVCSPQSLAGISASPDREVKVAMDSKGFAKAVLDLLEDEVERKKLGLFARKAVIERYSWHYSGDMLDGYLRSAVEARKKG